MSESKTTQRAGGAFTKYIPDGKEMSVYDAAVDSFQEKYSTDSFSWKRYGSGSPETGPQAPLIRDQSRMLKSYDGSSKYLVGMGVLPFNIGKAQSADLWGSQGRTILDIGMRKLDSGSKLIAGG